MIDTSILIDFENTDFEILSLFVSHLGEVYVVLDIIKKEMVGLDEGRCQKLGVQAVTPTTEQYLEAEHRRRPGLSFCDHLCLIVARDSKGVCVTNDRALRIACKEDNVLTVRGFRMLRYLVDKGVMEISRALKIAETMAGENPYLAGHALDGFRKQMSSGKYKRKAGGRTTASKKRRKRKK